MPSPAVLTSRGDRRFRPDIQGLRTVAVVLVVLYHCGVPGLAGGYVGVDVFFVISGFLITRQLVTERESTGRISLTGFYARRIKRLLPAALTVITATVVVSRFWGPALQSGPVARDGIFSTFYLMNYRLASEGIDYQNIDGTPSPLQHFWSLAVEEQFYILWPVLIIAVGLLTRRSMVALVALAGVAGAASLFASVLVTAHNAPLAYFSLQTRAWELGAGALLAMVVPVLLQLPAIGSAALGWIGLGAIVLAALVYDASTPFPGVAALLPVAGAVLVIGSGLRPVPAGPELLLGLSGFQIIGRLSYGWYLWHWPLIMLAPAVLDVSLPWPGLLLAALAGLGLAQLSYRWIEQPVARTRPGHRCWLMIGAGMSAAATLVAAVIIVAPPAETGTAAVAASIDYTHLDPAAVTAALTRASATTAVPANLTPSLSTAVDDVPPTTANGCHAAFLVITEAPCVFGDPAGTRTVVLFGDSHAEQWFGALDALTKARGWRLVSWTKAACPLADALFYSAQLQRSYTECPAWRSATLSRIAVLHPDLVIASGADALPGPGYSNVTWAAQTTATLTRLRSAAAQVVYLGDIPGPTSNVPTCLAAHLDATQECEFSRDTLTSGLSSTDQMPGRHAAVMAAAATLGVDSVDAVPWFCSDLTCPVIVGNTLLYRDATHMTQAYSRALAPVLGRALAARVGWMTG